MNRAAIFLSNKPAESVVNPTRWYELIEGDPRDGARVHSVHCSFGAAASTGREAAASSGHRDWFIRDLFEGVIECWAPLTICGDELIRVGRAALREAKS